MKVQDQHQIKPETQSCQTSVTSSPYRILNLYAGIGGNRQLWGDEYDITAVELDVNIAKVYSNLYPNDKLIVGDAHEYLIKNYMNFDFIWSSPPCPTHSRLCFSKKTKEYIDMKLYQEIVLLKSWFKGKYVVENIIPYYEPLISPNVILGRHPFWTNFKIQEKEFTNIDISRSSPDELFKEKGIDVSIFDIIKDVAESRLKNNRFDRRQIVRNMVNPEIGLHILNCALNIPIKQNIQQISLFDAVL